MITTTMMTTMTAEVNIGYLDWEQIPCHHARHATDQSICSFLHWNFAVKRLWRASRQRAVTEASAQDCLAMICTLAPPTHRSNGNSNTSSNSVSHSSNRNKLCTWRHNMPPPLSSSRGCPSASRAAEQTPRSSIFTHRIRSHTDRCSRLMR